MRRRGGVVLGGADGVVFVADSQRSMSRINNEFWHGMRAYLTDNSIDPDAIPIVIQFNKRDLPDIRTEEEIEEVRRRGTEPVYTAVAIRGEGVLETLRGLLTLVLKDMNTRYDFEAVFRYRQGVLRGLVGERPADEDANQSAARELTVSTSVLDDSFSLAELLDVEGFRECAELQRALRHRHQGV